MGIRDPDFVTKINKEFVCLAGTAPHYGLSAWKTGLFVTPPVFTRINVYGKLNLMCDRFDFGTNSTLRNVLPSGERVGATLVGLPR